MIHCQLDAQSRWLLAPLRRRQPPSTLFPYTTLFRSPKQHLSATIRQQRLSIYSSYDCVLKPSLYPLKLKRCTRSEEHTSELQSHSDLVCRLVLEKKNPTARRSAGGVPTAVVERAVLA